MKRSLTFFLISLLGLTLTLGLAGCGNRGAGKTLVPEKIEPEPIPDGEPKPHALFEYRLGSVIPVSIAKSYGSEVTGQSLLNDYDGDGIPNSEEIFTNPFVADYPRIVTRIAAPVIMEIEVDTTTTSKNHVETIENEDVTQSIENSMESKQYASLNKKTTPYVTKQSNEDQVSNSSSYGYDNESSVSDSSSRSNSNKFKTVFATGGTSQYGQSTEIDKESSNSSSSSSSQSQKQSENQSVAESLKKATMTEKTVFEDVNYVDNMDRSGIEFKSDTIKRLAKNYRKNQQLLINEEIGKNAGIVTAGLYLKNLSLDMPVRVSNIRCTLSFRTPSGQCHHMQTFTLNDENNRMITDIVGGGEELGPYTIKIEGLNTEKVRSALAGGYVPQIHVISYSMERVNDSKYNPGIDNIKMVEENLKGRTATIKIEGRGIRDIYRVSAYDIEKKNGEITLSPGISLKKALFHIFQNQTGHGENFERDNLNRELTVKPEGLKWKEYALNAKENTWNQYKGNSWDSFETYVKSYTDEFGIEHNFETIKRIGRDDKALIKYNPFDKEDNKSYNPNELLDEEEFLNMKYWIIFHNGKYYNGDLNDPIWAGDRYEIVLCDLWDFNKHFSAMNYSFTPLQSNEPVFFSTRWNSLNNVINLANPYPRARYLGKVIKQDVITFEIDLVESRFLFNTDLNGPEAYSDSAVCELLGINPGYGMQGNLFKYNVTEGVDLGEGKPGEFSHLVEGGTNNITIEIDKSLNAHYYIISFPGTSLRNVRVAQTELEKNNWKIVISRNTPADTGGTIGFIPTTVKTTSNGIIDTPIQVNVRAYGIIKSSYGNIKIYSDSSSNWQIKAKASVNDPDPGLTEGYPGPFAFSGTSLTDLLRVNISESNNAEYFLIRFRGPYMPGDNVEGDFDDLPLDNTNTVVGHAGMNLIDITRPSNLNIKEGVYCVEVVAANRYNVPTNIPVSLIDQFDSIRDNATGRLPERQIVIIKYDKYTSQKKYSVLKSDKLFDLRVVENIEVSFNNSSDWYRLILTNGNLYNGRKIDCRPSSYMDYANQKFYISFKAPSGEGNTNFNVFDGGSEEVDVYIRTVNEEKYRDRFWLKRNTLLANGDPSYIYSPDFIDNFVSWWLNGLTEFSTDATDLEMSVTQNEAFVNKETNNYFFAPFEYHCYRLKSSVAAKTQPPNDEVLPSPMLKVEPGNLSLNVTIDPIDLGNNEDQHPNYMVYWRPYDKEIVDSKKDEETGNIIKTKIIQDVPWDDNENLNDPQWKSMLVTSETCIITGLLKNREYIVAVVAQTLFSESKPVHSDPIRPYSTGVPAAPESIEAVYVDTGIDSSIAIEYIYVPGEYRYKVEYKSVDEAESEWHTYPYKDYIYETPEIGEMLSVTIESSKLISWKSYNVRVSAVNGLNNSGLYKTSNILEPDLPVPDATLSEDSKKIIFTGLDSRDGERMYQVYLTTGTDNNNNPLYGTEPLFDNNNATKYDITAHGKVHFLKFVPMTGIDDISRKTYDTRLYVEPLSFDKLDVTASWTPKSLIKSNRMTASEHCGKKHWNWEKAKYERHCSTSYTTYTDYFGNLRLSFKGLNKELVGVTGGTYSISGTATFPGKTVEEDIELTLPNNTYSITFDEQKSGFFLDIDFGLPHPVSSSVVAPKRGYMYLGYTNTNGDKKYYVGQGNLKFKFIFEGSNGQDGGGNIDISIPCPF